MRLSTAPAPKPSAAAFSRLVPIAARFDYVRNAAVIFSAWSTRGGVASFNCFLGYAKLNSDAERDHYLVARLHAIRQAHAAEFIRRLPIDTDGDPGADN